MCTVVLPVEARIPAEFRGMAVLAHLSGLAGYVIPLGGIVVPILVVMLNKDRAVIRSLARQALYLNLAVFFCAIVALMLAATVVLIPLAVAMGCVTGCVAIALPIIGAIRAAEGIYFRYPIIGATPRF
jgi:hypothetical protein